MTPAQLRTLRTAARDRSIIIGGIDGTPGVRRDVVRKLYALGYLRWVAAAGFHAESEWKPTPEGLEALRLAGSPRPTAQPTDPVG